jgi:2-methylcitrate dehydratase
MVAVALLDGQVLPEQYAPARIARDDVQALLRGVVVRPVDAYSRRFPAQMPCRVTIRLRDGRRLVREKEDYEGFVTRPMRWETVVGKFDRLAAAHADAGLRREIVEAVGRLEGVRVAELLQLLSRVQG